MLTSHFITLFLILVLSLFRRQFVPFRDYINTRGGAGNVISGARLAKDVLAELPDQFIDYMKKRGIKPASWQAQATR